MMFSPRAPTRAASAVPARTLALLREVTGEPVYGVTEKQLHAALRSGALLLRCVAPRARRSRARAPGGAYLMRLSLIHI